jgi:hypothetical protein
MNGRLIDGCRDAERQTEREGERERERDECANLSVRHFLDTDAIFTSSLLGIQSQ